MRALALLGCVVVVLVLTVPARAGASYPHPCYGPPINVVTGAGGCGRPLLHARKLAHPFYTHRRRP